VIDAAPVFVTPLPWDSEFFGFSVGRLVLSSGVVASELVRDAIRDAGCDLTYVFLPVGGDLPLDAEKPRSALVGLGGKCCDLKVAYRKTLDEKNVVCGGDAVTTAAISEELEALAYASGWCSRFVADDRLRSFFKPMYLLWLKRDLEQGKVFVLPSAEAPEGMATVSIQDGVGKVGLVAVDAKSCGKGLATRLMHNVDAWLYVQGVRECEVVTQGMNVAARHLYEKVGYKLHSQMEVWHIWKTDKTVK